MLRYIFEKYTVHGRFAKSQKHKVGIVREVCYTHFHQTKTVFIHIPKTAGVSLLKAIYGRSIIRES